MGRVRARRQDGSTFEVRTTEETRHIRIAHEHPVHVELAELGDTPALTELFLNHESMLETLDIAALAGHPALEDLTANVQRAFDLAPLASCPELRSLSLTIAGDTTLDFTPLHGHAQLETVEIGFAGTQAALDLAFARALPALTNLSIDGGDWRELDLAPLRGLPLTSLTLIRQYITEVDLDAIAQPALEHLMLQDLEVATNYWDLAPLARCPQLRFLSLLDNEVHTLEVSALAGLALLARFDPPNFKSMMMMPQAAPIRSPGLQRWSGSIGVE